MSRGPLARLAPGAAALLVAACVSGVGPASGKPSDAAFDSQVELTSGPGPVLARYQLRGQVLTKLVGLSADGAPVGISRATLAPGDPLPGAVAQMAESKPDAPLVPDSAVATIVVHRAAGERRAIVPLPPPDPQATRTLAALDAARLTPAATLELAVLPFASAKESNGTRPVTVRLTVRGVPGAEARVRAGDLAIQMADVRKEVPGVTPLPPDWVPVSEPAAGSATRAVKVGAPLDVPLRASIPAAGAFGLRAVLAGPVTFKAPGLSEEVAVETSSAPVLRE